MKDQQQGVIVFAAIHQARPEQWPGGELEGLPRVVAGNILALGFASFRSRLRRSLRAIDQWPAGITTCDG
jgi:hypothetical protein